jgi:hypothetical protein
LAIVVYIYINTPIVNHWDLNQFDQVHGRQVEMVYRSGTIFIVCEAILSARISVGNHHTIRTAVMSMGCSEDSLDTHKNSNFNAVNSMGDLQDPKMEVR